MCATVWSGPAVATHRVSVDAGRGDFADVEPGTQVYAGSLVRRGPAIANITATGPRGYFGRSAALVHVARASVPNTLWSSASRGP
jgi:magnesium-transporting ATPase (P-type)